MKNSFEIREEKKIHERLPHYVETISLIGGRSEQQDAFGVKRIQTQGRDFLCVVVADGHGANGEVAARSAVSHILTGAERIKTLDANALAHLFHTAHQDIVVSCPEGGSTATAVFLARGNVATIGWVGNCQARVFSKDNTLHTLTLPHEYGVHPDETKRLDANRIHISPFTRTSEEGGYGIAPQPSPKRGYLQTKGGFIEVSRSLGDEGMGQIVLHEPEFKQIVYSQNERFLIVATDGLWKKLERKKMRQTIEKLLAQATNARMAQVLVEGQLRKWKLKDNTTVVIVELAHEFAAKNEIR